MKSANYLDFLTQNIGLITIIGIIITAIVGAITIFAIFRAPVIALKIQKEIEDYKEAKQRKLSIFKTLLGTRENITSLEHVQALNMLDIEFYKEKDIRDSWNIYRDHLNSYPYSQDKSSQDRWEEYRRNYLTDLLYVMSKFFGYDFDKVLLKKGAYFPEAHGLLIWEQTLLRRGFIELLNGKKTIKIELSDTDKLQTTKNNSEKKELEVENNS